MLMLICTTCTSSSPLNNSRHLCASWCFTNLSSMQLQQSTLTTFILLFIPHYSLTLSPLLNSHILLSMTSGSSQTLDCSYMTTRSISWTYMISILRSFAESTAIPCQNTLNTTKLWNWCNKVMYGLTCESIFLTIASPVWSANCLRFHAIAYIEPFNSFQF